MDLRSRTGLALASLTDAAAYYEERVDGMPGAPEFSEEVLPWLRYLDNKRPGESWNGLRSRIEAEHDAATRGGDIFRAIYPDDPTESYKRFEAEDVEQTLLDGALVTAAGLWSETNDDPLVAEVFGALVDQTPMWSRIPVEHQPDSAEWLWSRMRMVCGSAGYNNHAALCERLGKVYPLCPMQPTETHEEWLDKLVDAHKNCGWPVQLGQLDWKDLTRCLSYVEDDGYQSPLWHLVVSMLHVLKHVRLDPESNTMSVLYAGNALTFEWQAGSNALTPMMVTRLAGPLHLPPNGAKKTRHPMTLAVRGALNRFTTNIYLRRQPTAALSGLVLHGPWSAVIPDEAGMDGFVQHGVRLTGVWLAQGGRVTPVAGTSADIVGYAWNHKDAAKPERIAAREQLERIIPERYTAGSAFDLFRTAFPNLTMPDGVDPDAVAALFDAPIVASLVRAEVPGLAFEYPIVAFLPQTPTLDESTNQGKTLATLTYARILAPSLAQVSSGIDSGSAPDMRDLADVLRTYGTLALDEFQVPKSKAHPLSRANLQMLCTGGRVSSGKVLENSGGVSLRHSLVVCAKALDFNPDMTNRTLPFYLSDLTDAHRDNATVLEDLQSGRLALLARLQMLAMIVDEGLTELIAAADKISTAAGLRFGVHRAIAKLLYQLRTGKDDAGQIDAAAAAGRARFQNHQATADDTGVLASLDEGRVMRVRISSLLGDLTTAEMDAMAGHLAYHGDGGWGPVGLLLNARAAVGGYAGKPLAEAVGAITGQRLRMANRSVILAVEREIRQTISLDAPYPIAGSSMALVRQDTPTGMLVRLAKAG